MKHSRRVLLKRSMQGLAVAALPSAVLPTYAQRHVTEQPGHPASLPSPAIHLNVRDFGAVGDGQANDTLAIQQALDRCSLLGGGEVLVPAGEYLAGSLTLRSNTTLQLHADATVKGTPDLKDYPLTQVRWEGRWVKGYSSLITAIDAQNIAIRGTGKIVGNPEIKGRLNRETQLRNPALLEFTGCAHVQVEGCFTAQNDMWSIHPVYCEDVLFRNVTVHGGADGIDVDSCKRVVIDSCSFMTGDDCISLKSGRGMEGFTLARPTEDVLISNCTFADQHWACIGIGSETSAGIRNVRIEHCKGTGARTFAIYIKTRSGRGAFLENIEVDDFEVSGAQGGFLRINALDSGKQDEFPVPGEEGIPSLRDFRFRNIRVHEVPVLVQADSLLSTKPLEGLVLENISGTCAKGILLANIQRAVLHDIHVTGFSGPLLSTRKVTGKGLEGAVPLEAPEKLPEPIPRPSQPYVLR